MSNEDNNTMQSKDTFDAPGDEPDKLEDPDLEDNLTGDDVEGEDIETRTAEELWDDARDAYSEAATPGVSKAHARFRVVEALEAECKWMDIQHDQEGDPYDLMRYDNDDGWVDAYKHVKDRMTDELRGRATDTEANHVRSFIQARNRVDDQDTNAGGFDATLIPLENGVLNINDIEYDAETGIDIDSVELEDEEPEHRFVYSLDTAWDPEGADLDGFDKWLETICPGATDRQLFREFGGHSIHPNYPVDGFLVVKGPGGSGKSMALEVIAQTIGDGSVGRSKLHKLENNRFEASRVVDMTVNIDKDLEGTQLDSMSKLKHLAAGEEISVERKGIDGYNAQNQATLLMAADNPPGFPQRNRALGRRLFTIDFPCEFVSDPDPNDPLELQSRPKKKMEEELQTDARCKAMLVRAVEGLAQLLETGKFSSPLTWEERVERYESHADPIADAGRTLLVRDPDGCVHADDVKAGYDRLAGERGHPAKSRMSILKTLGRFLFTDLRKDRSRSHTPGRNKDTVYHGMRFSDEAVDKYLPDDAHWDLYGLDEEGEERDQAPVATIEAGEGVIDETIRVTVNEQVDTPSYGWDDQGVLKDTIDTIRYKIENGTPLVEGATYDVTEAIACEFEGARVLHIVPGLTDVEMVAEAGEDESSGESDDESSDNSEDATEDDESGKSQDDRVKEVMNVIEAEQMADSVNGAKVDRVVNRTTSKLDVSERTVHDEIKKLKMKGELFEPKDGRLVTT